MAKVRGAEKFTQRLQRMQDKTAKLVLQQLYAGGQEIELEAERSITEGSVSGKNHIPSLPGEPPNADTRKLDTSIDTTIKAQGLNPRVHVTSNAPYSAYLEFGTARMEARPFMKPASVKKKAALIERVKKAAALAQK